MRATPLRLLSLYVATILAGLAATLLAPRLAGAQGAAAPAAPGLLALRLPVALRDLARGDTVRADDVAWRDTTLVWRWRVLPADTGVDVTGWVARRAIARGEALRAPAVAPPTVVESGATVRAIWQDGGVRLVLTGVAVNDAPLGAPVAVRIDRTRRLDGIAVAPNTVRLR
jgi:flagella basal body P-ring formation protein FlgA